jgi:hypothetical protein
VIKRSIDPGSFLFSLQDELSARVATTIAPQVQEIELRRVCAKHLSSLDAYECVLRGLDLLYREERDPWAWAPPLERAMALDPRYVGNVRCLAASVAASGQFKDAREVGRHQCRPGASRGARPQRRSPEHPAGRTRYGVYEVH